MKTKHNVQRGGAGGGGGGGLVGAGGLGDRGGGGRGFATLQMRGAPMEARDPPHHLLHDPVLGGIGTRSAVGRIRFVCKRNTIVKARGP